MWASRESCARTDRSDTERGEQLHMTMRSTAVFPGLPRPRLRCARRLQGSGFEPTLQRFESEDSCQRQT